LVGVAVGLLLGIFLPALPAALLAVAVSGGLVAAGIGAPLSVVPLPLGGLSLLTHLDSVIRPVAGSLQSAGAALAAAAALLVVAGAVLERSDL
jgi:hypothetical protein